MYIIVLVLCAITVRGSEPECGIVKLHGSQVLIIGGKSAQRGEVPWHAGIYKKTWKPYKQICGGSLISNNVIVSAAHCFWDEVEKQLPAERYAAAVGKLYRTWETNITKEEDQKSDVKEIHLPIRYQGSEANNQEDIAIVIVTSPFQYSRYVRPVCIDFDIALERNQLQLGNYGKVAGWGLLAEDGETSQILKIIELPYVDIKTCILESPFTYRPHITSDKFCAGYKDSNLAVCRGDSGGGLAFPYADKGKTRYYLQGVVSSAPVSDHQCNANAFTSFTQVLKHEHFIKQFLRTTSTDESVNSCLPIPPLLTQPKIGQKAWDKCIEYQEDLVFPCSGTATGSINRANRCFHNAGEIFTAGNEAQLNEFPHMALLGYDNDVWLCGGSLISENFVLTAAHCTSAAKFGPVRHVALGILKRSDLNEQNRFIVKQIHNHPDYNTREKLNDIALLELENVVTLSEFLVPACLHTGDIINDEQAAVTGWGLKSARGEASNELKKMFFTKIKSEECANASRATKNFDTNAQFCYVRNNASGDIWPGDTGGPIQVKSKKIVCMYTIVGVTSYATGTTSENSIAVFTRVAAYIDWIEKVVWRGTM